MNSILQIIKSINSSNPNINPTEIYNAGWMTRLLVYFSVQDKLTIKNIDFSEIKNWCSEAVISSPFQPRKRGDKLGEGFTHADMTIGDFKVDFSTSGEIKLDESAEKFGIIEAKMGSNLSQGTKNAPNYNQASRNLACIAEKILENNRCKTFFGVVAPRTQLKFHKLNEQTDKESMLLQITKRFEMYPEEFRLNKRMNEVLEIAKMTDVWVLSYEEWINSFTKNETKKVLSDFYKKAKKWNKIE